MSGAAVRSVPPDLHGQPPEVALPHPPRVGRRVRVMQPRRAGHLQAAKELWRFRRFLLFFGQRFIAKRYARTWLGHIWLPLKPGVNIATRILIYGGLLGAPSGGVPYPIAFLAATAAWQLFYESVYWSVRSVELNRKMLTQIYMPRPVLIFASVVPSAVDYLVNMSFTILAVLYYLLRAHVLYIHFGLGNLRALAGLIFMVLLGMGFGIGFAGVGARTRDVRFSLPFILSFLYFVTPIIYPLTQIPPSYRRLAELNPMTGAVEMVRDGVFGTHTVSISAALVTIIAILVLWGPGLWLADRREVAVLNGTAGIGRRRRSLRRGSRADA